MFKPFIATLILCSLSSCSTPGNQYSVSFHPNVQVASKKFLVACQVEGKEMRCRDLEEVLGMVVKATCPQDTP